MTDSYRPGDPGRASSSIGLPEVAALLLVHLRGTSAERIAVIAGLPREPVVRILDAATNYMRQHLCGDPRVLLTFTTVFAELESGCSMGDVAERNGIKVDEVEQMRSMLIDLLEEFLRGYA